MIKGFLLFVFCLFIAFGLSSQEVSKSNMPVYVDRMMADSHYTLDPLTCGMSLENWKKTGRDALLEAAGNFPPETPLEYKITATERREGYAVHKIEYNVSSWTNVTSYLLVPEGNGPFPGMLMLHDHGAHFSIGKEKMVRPFGVSEEIIEDADKWVVTCYDSVYLADSYAKAGFVVLVADALLWGDRQAEGGTKYETQQAINGALLQLGYSLGGLMLHDDMRALDLLTDLPMVDKSRIGCLGFSMGAYRAWMLGAASDKVKAVAAVCWMSTCHALFSNGRKSKGGSDYSMLIPGLGKIMDYPHVAAMICPRPLLLYNGEKDKLFPREGVLKAYNIVSEVYKRAGASEYLKTELWDEKHFFNKHQQEAVLGFFRTHFNL